MPPAGTMNVTFEKSQLQDFIVENSPTSVNSQVPILVTFIIEQSLQDPPFLGARLEEITFGLTAITRLNTASLEDALFKDFMIKIIGGHAFSFISIPGLLFEDIDNIRKIGDSGSVEPKAKYACGFKVNGQNSSIVSDGLYVVGQSHMISVQNGDAILFNKNSLNELPGRANRIEDVLIFQTPSFKPQLLSDSRNGTFHQAYSVIQMIEAESDENGKRPALLSIFSSILIALVNSANENSISLFPHLESNSSLRATAIAKAIEELKLLSLRCNPPLRQVIQTALRTWDPNKLLGKVKSKRLKLSPDALDDMKNQSQNLNFRPMTPYMELKAPPFSNVHSSSKKIDFSKDPSLKDVYLYLVSNSDGQLMTCCRNFWDL